MSSTSIPISARRFAEAIRELPLANLHFKAAEIHNSISHLESSNEQLEAFASEGDRDCAEAVQENRAVIRRMEERVRLLRQEVEGRGFKWAETERGKEDVEMKGNRHDDIQSVEEGVEQTTEPSGGSLGDEELAMRLMEQMDADGSEGGEGGEGLHL
ncbi:hypothetical protein P7C71_g4530, partial [Lecanoromycetidae sp. Uapishka_2]